MKISFLFITGIFISFHLRAQIFNKTYGTSFQDFGTSITRTAEGGFAVTGVTFGQGAGGEIFIMKLNHQGVVLWTKKIFGVNLEKSVAIYQLPNGNYIIGGNTYSYGWGCNSPCIIMVDSSANLVWARTYGDVACNYINSLSPTSDGGFIACGVPSGSSGTYSSWLFKIDANGTFQWSKLYSTDAVISVKEMSDHGFLAVNIKSGISLLKTDSVGNALWLKNYSSVGGNSQSFDIEPYGNGALITGQVYNNSIGGASDVYLLNVDSMGERIWFKTYGSAFFEYGYSVSHLQNNDIIISGKTNSFGHGDNDMFLIKTDPNGQLIWANTYGDAWEDVSNEVIVLPDSGFVSVGHSFRNSPNNDSSFVYVVRTDKYGATCNELRWTPVEQTQLYNPTLMSVSNINFGLDSVFVPPITSIQFSEQELCLADQLTDPNPDMSSIEVFPNPASSTTTIIYPNLLHASVSIRIFDMDGKLRTSFKDFTGKFVLNCESFQKGCYLIETLNDDKICRKILVIN